MFLKFLLLLILKSDVKKYPQEGIFPVTHTYCKSYKICSQLGVDSHECPPSTLFDPRAQKCVLNYICPDTGICASSPPGLYSDPNYPNNDKYFIECIRSNEGFEVRYGECGNFEIFVNSSKPPHYGSCQVVTEFTTEVATKRNPEEINITVTEQPVLSTTLSVLIDTTIIESSSENSSNTVAIFNVSSHSPENPLKPTTNSTTGGTPPETTETFTPTLTPIPSPFCQEVGHFPIQNSDCRGYAVCSYFDNSGNGYFVQTKYICPSTSLFDPWLSECAIGYKCLENACNGRRNSSLHSDPNDPNGSRYYQCVARNESVMNPVYLRCEYGYLFDETQQICFRNSSATSSAKSDKGWIDWIFSSMKWLLG